MKVLGDIREQTVKRNSNEVEFNQPTREDEMLFIQMEEESVALGLGFQG